MEKRNRFALLSMVLIVTVFITACSSPTGGPDVIGPTETVENPVMSILAGELASVPVTVGFTSATEGASFHYTTDGTDPTASSPSASSFEVTGPVTLKVIATKTGMNPSSVVEAVYTVHADSTNSSLASFSYSTGILTPSFSSSVTDYTLTVPDSVSSVTIAASATSSRASVTIDGQSFNGSTDGISVSAVEGASFVTRVVAEDGVSETSYTTHVILAHHGSFTQAAIDRGDMDDSNWEIAMSSDGSVCLAFATDGMELLNYLYGSTDGGTTWTTLESAGNREWSTIAVSGNGLVVLASYYESSKYYMIVSRDGGTSWSAPNLVNTSSPPYTAMSADGRYQYMSVHLDVTEGDFDAYDECLYKSDDYGATWTHAIDFSKEETSPSDLYWDQIVCSADGETVVAGGRNTWDQGGIMRSTDYGTTWSETYLGSNKPIRYLAMSADGLSLACQRIFSNYISNDLGATWTEIEGPRVVTSEMTLHNLFYSNDGSVLMGVSEGSPINKKVSYLFASSDNGKTWKQAFVWDDYFSGYSMAVSGDANKILLAKGYFITASSDGGESWKTLEGFGRRSWSRVSVSRNGQYQLAATSASMSGSKLLSSGWLFTSDDSGRNWTCRDSLGKRKWVSLAVSDACERLVAVYSQDDDYYVITSRDKGVSWSDPVLTPATWDPDDISISSNGEVILLTFYMAFDCYLSTDGGTNWSSVSAFPGSYTVLLGCSVSKDGSTLVIVTSTAIWRSVDGGQTWSSIAHSKAGSMVDISDDGKSIMLGNESGNLNFSRDGGASWSSLKIPGTNASAEDASKCAGVAISSDGSGIVVATTTRGIFNTEGNYAGEPGSLLISMDGGKNWNRAGSAGVQAWTDIAASEDLKVISATAREVTGGVIGCR